MERQVIPIIYKNMCPNCGGDISSERLFKGLVCENCLPEEVPRDELCDFLGYGRFLDVCNLWKKVGDFKKFFREIIKNDLWSIQETWATRFFLNISYALLAPTGIGKTTFGLVLSKYLKNKENKKSYLIFPTQMLVNQAHERLVSFGVPEEDILAYTSKFAKTKKKQEELKERIKNNDFKILLTTTMFLYKNIDIIPKGEYSLVFVDDVDSILKTARNIDKVLMLLGFSQEDIDYTLKFITFKQNLFKKGQPTEEDFELYQHWQAKIQKIAEKRKGVLIVSSATSNPRSKRVNLFRELLGFEVGRPSLTLRNIEDVYEKPEDVWEKSVDIIKKLGKGGLVFLSSSETRERLEEYVNFLNKKGINAVSYEDLMDRLDDYKKGKIQVAVGFASYRNPLARGIDLPDVIRYAVFVGVPKLQFNIRFEEEYIHLYYFMLSLTPFLARKKLIDPAQIKQLYEYINYLKIYAFIPPEKLEPDKLEKMRKIQLYVKQLIEKPEIFTAVQQSPEITLRKEGDTFILTTADVTGYVQASGRTSRLYAGGLTKGLAYLLVDDDKAFYSLQKKVKWFSEDIIFKPVEDVDLEKIIKQIDEDREKVRKVLSGQFIEEERQSFLTTVVIVESPNKARTIANFFGKPLRRKLKNLDAYEIAIGERFLTIVASKGHVYDLNKEEYYFGVKKNGDLIPIFEPIDESKNEIIQSIRELDLEVNEIFIATDPDTEGEKISYDLYLNSLPYNYNIKRAEFHEVTKRAFLEAIQNYRDFDVNLVKAQLVRRVADRWIGFTISQYIQKKLHRHWLSAGRVQTPVLEWIINRTDEAKQKIAIVRVEINGYPFEFQFEDKKKAKWFYDHLEFVIVKAIKRDEEHLFAKPFTTDAMLSEAARELRFSPQETMQLAQDLFEAGLITYHRTDSIRVSEAGVFVAKEYITENFGEEYFKPRTFTTAGGAHECIRPTRPMDADDIRSLIYTMNIQGITNRHIRLYELIFRRFIASQMKETVVEKTTFEIKGFDEIIQEDVLTRIIEHGYDLILPIRIYDIPEGKIDVKNKKSYHLKPKVPYYTFATVIQDMKEKGIGRPSTYAVTVQKLLDRHYIVDRRGYLFPTKLGRTVMALIKKREDIYRFVNENYTKELEEIMDRVERGETDYQEELEKLFEELRSRKLFFKVEIGKYAYEE
ncbi:Reverse gyrase [Persephonella hydrogeniphila]|uniref:Reverse gyrase n=1 Tax=Persephonella hydrogeniphila TaxID=198703 RepID=A0A285NMR3_9AQUI|nr:reverse gyrase [Persephonella hydrogeniphila]SNZ10518.1 Reverse gyrase [Persephonella hydrogeniphila]